MGLLTASVAVPVAVVLNVRAQSNQPEAPQLPAPNMAANNASPIELIAPQPAPAAPDRSLTTGFVRLENPVQLDAPLKDGLGALAAKDATTAINLRNQMPAAALDRQILSWAIATSGLDTISSDEIEKSDKELLGWPDQRGLRRNLERALAREQATPQATIEKLGNGPLQTAQGMIALARAYIAIGQPDKAIALLDPWWSKESLSPADEQAVFNEFGKLIPLAAHQKRLLLALYGERMQSARLLAEPAQAQSLVSAFVAVEQRAATADKLLGQIDAQWRNNPVITYLKVRKLRRAQKFNDAAALLLAAPKDPAALGNPDAWWNERRIISRKLFELGKAQIAYNLAAGHAAESPAMAAEAEFHAGWYALRGLRQAKLAAPHFARIAEISSGPISASRAFYWMARAAEAGGGDGTADYRRSAHFGTTFYGQLAAAKLGEKSPELAFAKPSIDEQRRFAGRPAVQAIKRFDQLGFRNRAAPLYIQLAQELDNVGELTLLANMAADNKNHYLALRVGKIAAGRGLDVGALSHPMGAIPDNANIGGSGKALAYAIARQESEFNAGAVSSAGARGLLQIMPATAKGVAARNSVDFSEARLTSDAAYNATLGAHFLGEQLARYKGSYILTFASYNAGPRRADDWIARYGDPRGKSIEEVVDWIEMIPFSETRNYVQRVLENYEVYKTRLTGNADISADLLYGRQ